MKLFLYTALALVAFAFNSIICRLALGNQTIDAASFTSIRLVSGALTLVIISRFIQKEESMLSRGTWGSALSLFLYAICFSFAYLKLTTATGALILFGSVQLTMICMALLRGERPQILEWLGLLLAFGGLIYLVFPGLSAPPLAFSGLMVSAGVAWGFYTLRGKGSADPLSETCGNFTKTVPMALVTMIAFSVQIEISIRGFILAILSGAIASGIGYSIWYSVLKHHTATRAAILQLAVPAIAALGGVIILSEDVSLRLIFASGLILGGIGLAIIGKGGIKSISRI